MVIEALQNLAGTLEQNEKRRKQMGAEDMMFLLGSKFVNSIQKATDTKSLSDAMMKANKIAYSMGIPQLAQQINNLGQIKQAELVKGKSDQLNIELSGAMRNIYKDQKVLHNGEYVTLGSLEEFKQGEVLDPQLQPQYYNQLANKYKTELVRELDTSDINKPMLRISSMNSMGETKLLKEYTPTQSGFYDDLLTKDTIEQEPQPFEITEFKNKMAEYNYKQAIDRNEFNYRQGAQERSYERRQLMQVQFGDGNMGFAIWDPKQEKFFNAQNPKEDITDTVTGKGYKPSATDIIKAGDVDQANQMRRNAAYQLVEQLKTEGKVDGLDDIITKHSTSGGGYNAIAVLKEINGSENNLDKLAGESGSISKMLKDYYAVKELTKLTDEEYLKQQKNKPTSTPAKPNGGLPKDPFAGE